jgi:hypothetical protein
MPLSTKRTFVGLFSIVAAGVIAGAIYLVDSRPAAATPQFGAATGQPCAACHVRPDGGPELTDYGKKFQANGDKPPKSLAPF